MRSKLNLSSNALSFNDSSTTNNPKRKPFDWTREVRGLSVENAQTYPGSIPVGSSVTVFDGIRTTTLDGTTAFTTTLSTLDPDSRYRFTWVSGTNPTLRTTRGLTLNTFDVTFTVNVNLTVNVTTTGSFSGVVEGDTIFIPNTTTGDSANVISTENSGFWQVLAVVSSTNLQLQRLSGESFEATGETVTLTANAQFVAFSAAGVQAGDSVAISAVFAVATQKTFTIDKVTHLWFEVLSTSAIPAESSKTPGATGLIFYTNSKRYVRIETDQEACVQFNGETTQTVRLSPWQAGDDSQPAWLEKVGSAYKLVIVNKSSTQLEYTVLAAE